MFVHIAKIMKLWHFREIHFFSSTFGYSIIFSSVGKYDINLNTLKYFFLGKFYEDIIFRN